MVRRVCVYLDEDVHKELSRRKVEGGHRTLSDALRAELRGVE